MTQSNSLVAAKEYSIKLSNDRERMQEKAETIRSESNELSQKKIELIREHQLLEKQFIRDEITAKELEAKKAEVDTV